MNYHDCYIKRYICSIIKYYGVYDENNAELSMSP